MADERAQDKSDDMGSGGLSRPPAIADDEGGGGAPEWMCTFSDLVTLLMCFFVLLYAMSTIQEETFKELVESMKSALGVQQIPETGTREGLVMMVQPSPDSKQDRPDNAMDEIGGMVQKEVQDIVSDVKELVMFNKLGGKVKVEENDEGAVITISDMVLFSPGASSISSGGLDVMTKIAKVLAQFAYPIKVAGHTDNIPIRTEQYASNWELSANRASDVVRFLISQGIDPKLLSAEGYAEFRPIEENKTAEGRGKNRRVEIIYERGSIGKALTGKR
ncbi:MAG: OmpA family protein [Proteobacteria bacterium]|nr:OmpA family protein [Pseudomonadota bacterium]